MDVRRILSIFVALSVLFAPSFTRAGAAFAAAPDHQARMMEAGPCKMPPANSADHKAPAKSCCMAMCMAVAVTPEAPARGLGVKHAASYFAVPSYWHGFFGEIATPPPRTA